MTDIVQQEIEKCISFPDYLSLSKAVSNPVGMLTLTFLRLHRHAPPSDIESLGGRIAKLWTITHKDTGYLLKIIWVTSSADIAGSHLNYIQGMLHKDGYKYNKPALQGHAGMKVE